MKSLNIRVITSSLLLGGAFLTPVLAWSMSEMTDSQLATTTGQDGITLLIAPPSTTAADATGYTTADGRAIAAVSQLKGLKIGAVLLHDKDGFAGFTSAGALVIGDASQANTANAVGVQMGIYGSTPIKVIIDASNGNVTSGTGGTTPMLNVNVALPSDLLIRTGDVLVDVSNRTGIAVGAAGATQANAAIGGTAGKAVKVMNSMDIAFGGTAISFNIQLANTPQGGMISFGTLQIPTITFSGLSLASPNAGLVLPSQLTMTPKITNLDLTGLTIDVVKNVGTALGGTPANGFQTQGGLLFSDSSFTIGGIELNNVMAGNACAAPCAGATIAQGLANAPLGSFGVTGMIATNLKIGVSGM